MRLLVSFCFSRVLCECLSPKGFLFAHFVEQKNNPNLEEFERFLYSLSVNLNGVLHNEQFSSFLLCDDLHCDEQKSLVPYFPGFLIDFSNSFLVVWNVELQWVQTNATNSLLLYSSSGFAGNNSFIYYYLSIKTRFSPHFNKYFQMGFVV